MFHHFRVQCSICIPRKFLFESRSLILKLLNLISTNLVLITCRGDCINMSADNLGFIPDFFPLFLRFFLGLLGIFSLFSGLLLLFSRVFFSFFHLFLALFLGLFLSFFSFLIAFLFNLFDFFFCLSINLILLLL